MGYFPHIGLPHRPPASGHEAIASHEQEFADRKARRAAQERSDDRFAAIFDQVSDGIFVADSTTGKFIEVNRPGCRMFGYSREEIIGADIGLLSSGIHPYTLAMAIEHNREAQARRNGGHIGEIEPFEWQAKTKDGKLFWVEMSLRPTEFSHAPATVAVVRDITERKKLNDRIAFMAEHDPLTGLPNRLKFTAALERQIEQSKRSGRGFFVMFLDLDRFKEVNDGRGHPVGDELLRLVAARLQAGVRQHETVARFGGDEFAILTGDNLKPADAAALARRLIASIGEPFPIGGHEVHVSISIGIAEFGGGASDADTLMSRADVALYRAKDEGRNRFCFHDDAVNDAFSSRVA
jgi:diguanylate cyclase (GGDEF)-like protein/PAS domain S-box-containing protein